MATLSSNVPDVNGGELNPNSEGTAGIGDDKTVELQGDQANANPAGARNLQLTGSNGDDSLNGLAGNDSILGLDGADTLDGRAGDDTLYGNAGQDSLIGGGGDNILWGGANDDILTSADGADTLRGGANNDSLDSGNGQDQLFGGAGTDTLVGGNGQDTLTGGDGVDSMQGGLGNDRYVIADATITENDFIRDNGNGQNDLVMENLTTPPPIDFGTTDSNSDGNLDGLQIFNTGHTAAITIENYFDDSANTAAGSGQGSGVIETIQFADSTLSFADIQALLA